MPGPNNYDGIIREVLNSTAPTARGDESALVDYPKTTAKVPQDRMRDTPWVQEIPPITGNERDTRVFSDKEWALELLYKKMEQARQMYGIVPDETRRQNLTNAAGAYDLGKLDPTLPANIQSQRLEKEGAQAPIDASVMMKAIENRQRLGRK